MAPSYDNLPTEDGFEDEEDEIDFSDLDAQREVRLDEGYDTFVLIDGLPRVPEDSMAKLIKFVLRKLVAAGKTSEDLIHMPVVDGMTEGYAFVEYATAEQAVTAVKTLHGTALDKRHTMAVNKITDIERYGREGRINDEYVAPEIEPFKEKEHLRWWLGDAEGRDQLVMFSGDSVGIYWNQKDDAPEGIVDRKHWTETFTAWSPLGVYLASMHMQGVQLWGGPSWTRLKRFPHPGVNLIDFSPNENYITTWSHRPITVDEGHPVLTADEEGKNYIIWDIATGKPLRSFENIEEPSKVDDQGNTIKKKLQWPAFKWSADDKYVARLNPGKGVSVYELPSMVLLDKSSVKIDGIVDFEWAPATPQRDGLKTYEQLFCFWTPEIGSNPAKVGLMSIPSKEIVRTRNLFNVSDAKLHWQSQAKYVCVKVDRHSKSKKSMATNLEIFRVREKGVPVEVIDSLKDTVINFAWEPQGDRFVIITAGEAVAAQGAAAPKTSISFYCPEKAKGNAPPGNFRHIRTLEKRNSNGIYWSPKGRFVVIATVLSQLSSELEFFDCDFEGEKDEKDKDLSANLQSMALGDHYGVTDVDWDPTGRYVASSASLWKNALETGYHIYNSTGTLLREESVPQFKQFSWRPRPATLLSKEEQKQVRRNLREYAKQFDAQDEAKKSSASKELIEQRRRLVEEWRSWRERLVQELREMREEYGVQDVEEVRKAEAEEEGEAEVEEIVEEIIKESEEVID